MKGYHRQTEKCCTAHRLALVHAGFEPGRRVYGAMLDDLDVSPDEARHAWRNALILAAIVGLFIIGGLIGGPGSF